MLYKYYIFNKATLLSKKCTLNCIFIINFNSRIKQSQSIKVPNTYT